MQYKKLQITLWALNVIEMKKITFFTLLIMLSSCGAQQYVNIDSNYIYDVLNTSIHILDKQTILYPKAYTSSSYGRKFIADELDNLIINYVNDPQTQAAYRQIDSVKALEGYSEAEIQYLAQKISRKNLLIRVTDFLTKEDIEYMAKMANRKKVWKRSKLESKISISRNKSEALRISVPVFNRENTFAMYFSQSNSSLDAVFCRKNDGLWQFYCSATLWVE